MSGGGGTQVTSQDPWEGAQPYLHNQLQGAWNLYHQGPKQFFPGQTFADPTAQQLRPYNYGFDFMNQAFGNTGMQADWQGPQNYGQPQQIYDPSKDWQTDATHGQFGGTGMYSDAILPGMPNNSGTIDMPADSSGSDNISRRGQAYIDAGYGQPTYIDNRTGQPIEQWRLNMINAGNLDPNDPGSNITVQGQPTPQMSLPLNLQNHPGFNLPSGSISNPVQGMFSGPNTTQQQFAPTIQNKPQMSTGLTAGKIQPAPTGGPNAGQQIYDQGDLAWQPGTPTPGGSMDPNSQNFQGYTPGQKFAQQQGYTPGQQGAPIAPNYGSMVDANQQLLSGQTPAGQFAGGVVPGAMQELQRGFNLPINSIGNPGQVRDPSGQIRDFSGDIQAGFDPSLGDPSQALQQMLSGRPNYDQVQAAVRAGAQPTLDILSEDIMPQLRSRTVGSNNATGEIKDLNRIVPRVMRDITNTGTQAALGEYNRALGSQERGAGLASNLGLNLGQLGLQGDTTAANLGMRSDQARAGLGMQSDYQNANLGLQGDIAQQQAYNAFRNASLGYGNLGLGAAGQVSGDMATGVGQFPSTLQTGMAPFNFGQQYGGMTGQYENAALGDAMNRWNFNEQAPYDLLNSYTGMITGAGGLGGTQTSSASSNPLLGAAGGALAGAAIPGMLGPAGMGLMAANPAMWPFVLGGGLLGAFG